MDFLTLPAVIMHWLMIEPNIRNFSADAPILWNLPLYRVRLALSSL